MRVGVVGDIHGNYSGLRQAVRNMGRIDFLLFTGDGYRDISRLKDEMDVPVEGVTGNCDFCSSYPQEQTLTLEGCKILLTHGHIYGVKNDLTRLGMAGREQQVELVVFGHTHEAVCTDWYEVKLLNPGSLSYDRSRLGPSYGLIEISEKGIYTSIIRL